MRQSKYNLHQLLPSCLAEDSILTQQPLQKKLPLDVRKIRTNDVYEHGCSLTGWQQLYEQLTTGQFYGSLFEIWLDGVQIVKESSNHALQRSCMIWSKSIWLAISESENDRFIYFCRVGADGKLPNKKGDEFKFMTQANCRLISLVIPENELNQYFDIDAHFSSLTNSDLNIGIAHIDKDKKKLFCFYIQQIFLKVNNWSDAAEQIEIREQMKDFLLTELSLLLQQANWQVKIKHTVKSYQKTILKARNYILTNQGQNARIDDLCSHLYTSRRTLQNAFERTLNINPVRYLKAIRLNAVHRELLSSYSIYESIQDAAAAWGFNHMSQFAVDYQQLFNELPSRTIRNKGRVLQQIVNR